MGDRKLIELLLQKANNHSRLMWALNDWYYGRVIDNSTKNEIRNFLQIPSANLEDKLKLLKTLESK